MLSKPKIGVLFLAGDSWWEAGICTAATGPYAGFLQQIENDVAAATAALAKDFTVISSGLLHTTQQIIEEARRFNVEKVEAIVFCPIIWTNDPPVIGFIREANKVPLALWAYDPYGSILEYYKIEVWLRSSGPVSVQQVSCLFRNHGWDYAVIFGNEKDETCLQELLAFLRAATVMKSLTQTRIAMLPGPCQMVMGAWIDEKVLYEQFGVELVHVSVQQFAEIAESISNADAGQYVQWLKEHAKITNTPEDMLLMSSKHALAMVKLTEDLGLSGIALDDFHEDFYKILGVRPHLYHPRLGELGCTIGLEADVPGILATLIMGRLAGHQAMFNEFYTIDKHRDLVLMGHPGMGELSVGDPASFEVTPDLEFDENQKRGAWISYRAKPGPMTHFNLTPDGNRLKATAWTGEAIFGPRLMEGYAHMLVHPDTDALPLFQKIVERGLVQHWGTVHGKILPELRHFARLTGLDLVVL